MKLRTTPFLGPLLLLGLAPAATALQLEKTRPELCAVATHVVVGEVTGIETRWATGDEGVVEREAHVTVLQRVAGPSVSDLLLHLPGGQIDDLRVEVEDVPKLLENAQYLLFVALDPQGRAVVIGGDAGAVRILPEGSDKGEPLDVALRSVEVCRAR